MVGSVKVKPSHTIDLRAYVDIPYKPSTAPDKLVFENEMKGLVWHRVLLHNDLPASLNVPYLLDLKASFILPFHSEMRAKIELNKHAGKIDFPGSFEIVKFSDLPASLTVLAANIMWGEIIGKERPTHYGHLVCTSHMLEPLCIMKSEVAKFSKRLYKQDVVLFGEQDHGDTKGLLSNFNKYLGHPIKASTTPPEQKVYRASLALAGELEKRIKEGKAGLDNRWTIGFGHNYSGPFGLLQAYEAFHAVLNKRPRDGAGTDAHWLRGFVNYSQVVERALQLGSCIGWNAKDSKVGYEAWVKAIVESANNVDRLLYGLPTWEQGTRIPKDEDGFSKFPIEWFAGYSPSSEFSISKLLDVFLAQAGILVRTPHIKEHKLEEIYWTHSYVPDGLAEFTKLLPTEFLTGERNIKDGLAGMLDHDFIKTLTFLTHGFDTKLNPMYRLLFGYQTKHIVPTFEMAASYLFASQHSKTLQYSKSFTKVTNDILFKIASPNAKDTTASNIFEHLVLGKYLYDLTVMERYLWALSFLIGERTPKDCAGGMLPHLWLPDHMNLSGNFDRTKLFKLFELLQVLKDTQPAAMFVEGPRTLSIARFMQNEGFDTKLHAASIPGTAPVTHTNWPGDLVIPEWLKGWQGSDVPFEITKLLNTQFLQGDWDDTEHINDPFYDTLRKMIKNRNSSYIQMI